MVWRWVGYLRSGKISPSDDDDIVPVKADGSYDRQAIWQRYRRIARRQLHEGGQSVKASAVNELARSLYREDGW